MDKLRVKFIKQGAVRYTGHLDVMRYFQKVMRRAEIDICYSSGFSPHQIMSFCAPLGVGMESEAEYMDIEVNSFYDFDKMVEDINAVNVPGFLVKSIKLLPENAENAMASMQAARYKITLRKDRPSEFDLKKSVDSFNQMDSYVYEKETKKGSREVNLKEFIYELKYIDEDSIEIFVCANSGDNIKPIRVIQTLFEIAGINMPENPARITRIDSYTIVDDKFISLGEI